MPRLMTEEDSIAINKKIASLMSDHVKILQTLSIKADLVNGKVLSTELPSMTPTGNLDGGKADTNYGGSSIITGGNA